MVYQEIFRHAKNKLRDYCTSKTIDDVLKAYEPQIKSLGGELNYTGFSEYLGARVKILNIQNKNFEVYISAESSGNIGSNMSLSIRVSDAKYKFYQDLSILTSVYANDSIFQHTTNINDQYKTLLKTFFNKVNVEVFKLSKTYKAEGIEPVIFKFIQAFCRSVNTYLISTSDEEILLSNVYTKKVLVKYIDLL